MYIIRPINTVSKKGKFRLNLLKKEGKHLRGQGLRWLWEGFYKFSKRGDRHSVLKYKTLQKVVEGEHSKGEGIACVKSHTQCVRGILHCRI